MRRAGRNLALQEGRSRAIDVVSGPNHRAAELARQPHLGDLYASGCWDEQTDRSVVADLDGKRDQNAAAPAAAVGHPADFNPDRPPTATCCGTRPGFRCYKDAVDLLRPPQQTHRHGLLLTATVGRKPPANEWKPVEDRLVASGWSRARGCGRPDPELEAGCGLLAARSRTVGLGRGSAESGSFPRTWALGA